MNKKKILIIIPIVLILLIGIIACISIFTGTKKNDTPKNNTTTSYKEKEVYTTIIVEINPKLALEIDSSKKVINMYPLNKDAKEFDRKSYIGKTLDEGIEQVMTDAKDYIKKNGKITISVADESKEEKHLDEIKDLKKEIVEIIEEKNDDIEVKQVELSNNDIKEIIESVEEIKVEDKKEITSTTSTTTTTTTSTTTSTTKKTTTKKTTKKTTTTTTKKPDYNLNDNIKFMIGESIGKLYVYPNNAECKGKFPGEVTIPDGKTYDEYCQNKIPSTPVVKGKGYYCQASGSGEMEPGVTTNKAYKCTWIEDIISSNTVEAKLDKILKKSNAVEMAGGAGGADEITLDEAACKKYSLSCGRW